MREMGDTTPYQTDFEVGLDMPGLSANVVVSHDAVDIAQDQFVDGLGAFARFEPHHYGDPTVLLEGRFNAEQLLALFLVLKSREE